MHTFRRDFLQGHIVKQNILDFEISCLSIVGHNNFSYEAFPNQVPLLFSFKVVIPFVDGVDEIENRFVPNHLISGVNFQEESSIELVNAGPET